MARVALLVVTAWLTCSAGMHAQEILRMNCNETLEKLAKEVGKEVTGSLPPKVNVREKPGYGRYWGGGWKKDGDWGWVKKVSQAKFSNTYFATGGQTIGIHIRPITWVSKDLTKEEIRNCSPKALAKLTKILAHEFLHKDCPPHKGTGGGPANGSPPQEDPPFPDCNDLNYGAHALKAFCAMMGRAADAASDPPMKDSEGEPIPGLETCEQIVAYCEAMKAQYEASQAYYNRPEIVARATDCTCGTGPPENEDPWEPDDCPPDPPVTDYSNCPGFPEPPNGCDNLEPYPDGKFIPDCPVSCGSCN